MTADRLSDYFQRQIAHYKTMLSDHDRISSLLEAGDLDAVESLTGSHARESALLEREFTAILREWQSEQQSEAARTTVRRLAREASDLATQLETILNSAAGSARDRRNAVKREWEAIRRGQNVIDHYRTSTGSEPDRIDKNA